MSSVTLLPDTSTFIDNDESLPVINDKVITDKDFIIVTSFNVQ